MTVHHQAEALPRAASGRGGLREVLHLAHPVVLTQLSTTAMGVVDSAMVGRLGATQLAAVGFGAIWMWTIFSLFYGTANPGVCRRDAVGFHAGCGHAVGDYHTY